MTKHGIWLINNKNEAKLLRKKLVDFDFKKYSKKETSALINKMRKAMKEANGVGLSANQIGLDLNVFVAQANNKFYAIFNPKILAVSKEKTEMEEGCLSVPEIFGTLSRHEKIVVEAYDKNGKKAKIKAWGFLAKIFQHEIDHLNGKLFIDHTKNTYKYQLTADK